MSDQHVIDTPPPGKIELTVGGQLVDITELGSILTAAGESINACFGTADSAAEYRRRAEAAEAKLEQLADLVNFHGTLANRDGGKVILLDWAHLTKIMNGTRDE
ncbi:hypothetical protein [Leucobacter sp. G161]|uniref:hypothetical protein n=1 Tax=Leucobacter sp. G161 TaxID=663704 RepID=UPI00073B1498|nr:hypothetical protein [Leucobacter sp. G161]KUF07177.1 hypothetical protein AUL38_02500 [Leucobacter sp. G161]